jgi:SAM-dependent methyltransferase
VVTPSSPTWNHNTHYHQVLLDALPAGAHDVLDVGCGDGALARDLAARGLTVTALDLDEPTLARAGAQGGEGVTFVHGDFLRIGFGDEQFDAVLSVAVLHHLDAEVALLRMRELVRPGGVVGVIGLAKSRRVGDVLLDLAAIVPNRWLIARHGYAEVLAPTVWPPPLSYSAMRRIARRVLPGATFRRRLLWRYSLIWVKPAG